MTGNHQASSMIGLRIGGLEQIRRVESRFRALLFAAKVGEGYARQKISAMALDVQQNTGYLGGPASPPVGHRKVVVDEGGEEHDQRSR